MFHRCAAVNEPAVTGSAVWQCAAPFRAALLTASCGLSPTPQSGVWTGVGLTAESGKGPLCLGLWSSSAALAAGFALFDVGSLPGQGVVEIILHRNGDGCCVYRISKWDMDGHTARWQCGRVHRDHACRNLLLAVAAIRIGVRCSVWCPYMQSQDVHCSRRLCRNPAIRTVGRPSHRPAINQTRVVTARLVCSCCRV